MTINKITCGTSTGSELANSTNATINTGAISNRVAVVGTSLMQQMTDFAFDRVRYTNRGWLYLAQALTFQSFQSPCWQDEFNDPDLGDRGFWGLNYGVGGAEIQDIIDAANNVILADLIAAKVNYVIVDGGTNDIANLSITATEIHDKRVELFEIFASAGIKVIALTILTSGTTRWPSGGGLRVKAAQVNAMSREYIKTVEGIYLLDWNEDYMDFSNQNGIPIAGYSSDNVHFSFQGAFAFAQQLASFMNTLLPSTDKDYSSPDDLFDSSDNVTGNIFPNPYLVGTAGTAGTGVTGDVADDLTIENRAGTAGMVASKETGDKGDVQVVTFTPTGDRTQFRFKPTASTFVPHGGVLADKWVVMECDVELSDYSQWEEFSMQLLSDGTDPGQVFSIGAEIGEYLDGAFIGRLQTPPLLLSSDSTGVATRFFCAIGGAAGTPVIKISAFNTRQVDDLRLSYDIGHF